MANNIHGPLTGVTVVDLGQIYNGPYCTFLMAMAGARVIKVEPRGGENLRRRAKVGGAAVPFAMLNSNKQFITLDLKTARGKALIREMVAKADVLIENFSQGAMERLGLGYDALKQVNPGLIYASGSGYGRSGPMKNYPAMDIAVQAMSGLDSKLELEYEKLYSKLFLASVRHGTGGARKRYAGVLVGETKPEFVGMEVVRRDWTELAKQVQRELYQRLFTEQPVVEYLHNLVGAVRRGECNDLLVYRKGLRKDMREYTTSTPPHVAAARKSKSKPGNIIAYVMTQAGPEPMDGVTAPYDLEHYTEKQVRPVAEPVLAALGLDFAQVVGDDRQLGLF